MVNKYIKVFVNRNRNKFPIISCIQTIIFDLLD